MYPSVSDMMPAGFAAFWAIYFAYILLVYGLSILMYVLRAIGMYSIAKRRGIKSPWMAWVPVVDQYLLGSISDQYHYVVKGENKSKRKALLTLNIIMWVLYIAMMAMYGVVMFNMVTGAIDGMSESAMLEVIIGPTIGMLGISLPIIGIAIAIMIIRYMALYDLYQSCSPNNAVLYLVLGIVIGFLEPIFIFVSRKKDDGMPPRKAEPVGYIPQQPAYQPAEPVYQPPVYQPAEPVAPVYQSEEPVYQPEESAAQSEASFWQPSQESEAPAAEPVDPWDQV